MVREVLLCSSEISELSSSISSSPSTPFSIKSPGVSAQLPLRLTSVLKPFENLLLSDSFLEIFFMESCRSVKELRRSILFGFIMKFWKNLSKSILRELRRLLSAWLLIFLPLELFSSY